MALLANQLMDARVLSGMNGHLDLPQFMRVQNQDTLSQVTTAEDDSRRNRKYPCPLCGKRFRFNSILSLHMRTHTGEKPFKCPYCDHRAAQKGNLKIHLRTHKQGNLGKGRVRVREENRLLHELEERAILRDRQSRGALPQPPHIPSPQQPQQRPQLAQAHPQLSLTPSGPVESLSLPPLSGHLNPVQEDHIQIPPPAAGFRCSFCKGKFRKQQELERHIRILHKPYKCTLCEFAASQEEELISHVETAHITSEAAQGQKPEGGGSGRGSKLVGGEFPCEVCGQTFSQAWFLKGHMRKHKDSFEHCCQICGRRFKEPWFLKNHMKVHLNKLAAKSKQLPAVPNLAVSMSSIAQDTHTNLYSQYISSLHGRFLSAERAGQSEFHQTLTAAGIGVKVKEMLGKMLAPGQGLTGGENRRSLLGLNPLVAPLSSTSMAEYLRAASERDSHHGYPGWQIMAPGLTVEQVYTPKEQQQQLREYLAERRVCVRDPESTRPVSRPSTPGLSHVLEGSLSGTGLSHTGSVQEDSPLSCSPASAVTGEKPYRCPPSGDYTSPPTATLSYHLERLLYPQWQDSRDPSSSSPPPPSPKPKPKPRDYPSPVAGPYSGLELEGRDDCRRDPDALPSDLSNLHGLYQGPEGSNLTSQTPLQTFVNNITSGFLKGDRGRGRGRRGGRGSVGGGERSSEGEDCFGVRGSDSEGEGEGEAGTGNLTVKARKSQYEPLDLSLRPEWAVSASQQPSSGPMERFPAGGLLQQPSVCHGSLSSSALRLQVYSAAPSESTVETPPQSELSEQGSGSDLGSRVLTEREEYEALQDYDSSGFSGGEQGAAESPVCHKEVEEEEEEEISMMESSNSSEMMLSEMAVEDSHGLCEASQCPKEMLGQWGRSLTPQPPLSPLELLMPGQAHHHHEHHMNMLSVLRSFSGLDHRVPNGHTGSSNGGGVIERVDPPGQKPFQCRYCPYGASQKGNLKTHVLCVHRKPFDSTLYPDRRLRRPHNDTHSPPRDRTPLEEGSSHLLPPQGVTGDAPTPGTLDITMASLCGT